MTVLTDLNADPSFLGLNGGNNASRHLEFFSNFAGAHMREICLYLFCRLLSNGVSRRISRLLLQGGPSAIARLVIPINMNSIERMLRRRPGPHVGIESLKAFNPFLADGYPASPVSVIPVASRVEAPVFHRYPCPMLWGERHPVLFPSGGSSFLLNTPAAFSRSPPKIAGHSYRRPATGAKAKPFHLLGSVLNFFKNGQSAKRQPGQINLPHFLRITL